MTGPRVAAAVLRKELLLDWRSRDRIGHMLVFSALVVVLVSITLQGVGTLDPGLVPTLLFVVLMFSAVLGLSRSFQAEVEDGARVALAQVPCDRGWVFLGKALAMTLALLAVALATALLFGVFLGAPFGRALGPLLGSGLLAALGLAGIGTTLSTMAGSARFREFLLPLLLFPFQLPVLVIASRIVTEALGGRAAPAVWWGALALYDWVFLLVGFLCFDYLLED